MTEKKIIPETGIFNGLLRSFILFFNHGNGIDRTGRYRRVDLIVDGVGLLFDEGFKGGAIKLESIGVDQGTGVAADAGILIDNYFFGHMFPIITDRFGRRGRGGIPLI